MQQRWQHVPVSLSTTDPKLWPRGREGRAQAVGSRAQSLGNNQESLSATRAVRAQLPKQRTEKFPLALPGWGEAATSPSTPMRDSWNSCEYSCYK